MILINLLPHRAQARAQRLPEACRIERDRRPVEQRLVALAASRSVGEAGSRHAIERTAARAGKLEGCDCLGGHDGPRDGLPP